MTVSYTGNVANSRLCGFSRLLFYWKGSVYKLVYKEMLIFIALYTLFSIIYRFALLEWQKRIFEQIVMYCAQFVNLIPLSFILGFYVAIVVTRWWNQFLSIPWPDRMMMQVSILVEGTDEHTRIVRRTIMRYLSLATLMVLRQTSVSVKKRFPTNEHLIESGMMTPDEAQMYEEVETPHGRWWVPIFWANNLIKAARNEGIIPNDYLLKTLLDELQTYRGCLGTLLSYDWISIPLVYTQVTTLAVYTFFLGMVFGRQFVDPVQGYTNHEIDMYIPLFTLLQFFFYMGWLKVAEQMINPFGEDDDDFEMNWIIDRNMQISLLCVDDLHQSFPKLQKDIYFDEQPPDYLPYTSAAFSSITKPFKGSCAQLSVSDAGAQFVQTMETIQESGDSPQQLPKSSSVNQLNSPFTSPVSSPRQIPANRRAALLAARPHLSLSKMTLNSLNGIKPADSASSYPKSLYPSTNHGTSIQKAQHYLDNLVGSVASRHGSKLDLAVTPSSGLPYVNQPKLFSQTREGQLHHAAQEFDALSQMSMTPAGTMQDIASPTSESRFSVQVLQEPLARPNILTSNTTAGLPQASAEGTAGSSKTVKIDMESEVGFRQMGALANPDVKKLLEKESVRTIRGSNESVIEVTVTDSGQSTVNSLTPLLDQDDGDENPGGSSA